MAMIKPKLKYRIVKGINPRTKETLNRPVLVDRETQYSEQVADCSGDDRNTASAPTR